jgi:uncharacterized protein YfiM (DUF2279 family)
MMAAVSGALLIGALAVPALAQTTPAGESRPAATQAQEEATTARRGRSQQRRSSTAPRSRPPATPNAAAPDPAVVLAEAQAVITAAGNACQATEAAFMGQDANGMKVYEAVCASGPGYIVMASAPPVLTDCVLLAGQAETMRARDPNAEVPGCKLAGNQNVLGVIGSYAQAAGVTCQVDQAVSRGRAPEGGLVYEVGCAGQDGFWIEQGADGWTKTECTQIVSQNATCRFTTPAEQAASLKTRLADSAASDCDVQAVRFMGYNANGRFYEAKCAAEGTGYIARTNPEGVVQQVYACASAQRIGGGCTLTAVAAPATEATPAPTQR